MTLNSGVTYLNSRIHEIEEKLFEDLGDKIKNTGAETLMIVNSQGELTSRFRKMALAAGINAGEQEGGEIFGEAEVALLGNEKINIEIRPTDFEVSIDDFEEPKKNIRCKSEQ